MTRTRGSSSSRSWPIWPAGFAMNKLQHMGVERGQQSEAAELRVAVVPERQDDLADNARALDRPPEPAVAGVRPVVAQHVELAGRHPVGMLAGRVRDRQPE